MDLDAVPEAVPVIRSIVGAHLRLWGVAELTDRVTLGVTELLANAVRHTLTDPHTGARHARLTVTLLPGALNVCVRDHSRVLPQLNSPRLDAEHGRGLRLLAALADGFGCAPAPDGKDVWANFAIPGANTDRSPTATPLHRSTP
ncbi:ATP-binding protein [Streptomyces antibioticus]|uniref:ATP-binding protein n=1 Tax=Streptomyces antibioticus TaxID=1890 RepID=UPI0022580D86|nr:ATP-binding protein [Streptomyces antibioticus]MCX4740837.1 ATP-binding protein [Streptomyces antibioticus]